MQEEKMIQYPLTQRERNVMLALNNNELFQQSLAQCLAQAGRNKRRLSILMIRITSLDVDSRAEAEDFIDQFVYGLIIQFEQQLNLSGAIFSLGDNKLAIVVENIKDDFDSALLIDKIFDIIKKPLIVDEKKVRAFINIGVASFPEDGQTIIELFNSASMALHRARNQTKQYSFYDIDVDKEIEYRFQVINDLTKASENEQFYLRYQPIYQLQDKQPVAIEALMRWDHPALDIIGPAEFIPIAEKTGLILDIGRWIFDRAFSDYIQWQKKQNTLTNLFIKVCSKQFHHPDFCDNLLEKLAQYNIVNHRLTLEIRQDVLQCAPENSESVLQELRKHDIAICLEAYGLGHSCMRFLNQALINVLKLEQSLCRNICHDKQSQQIVQAILVMAEHLNLSVIAHGVETDVQLAYLNQLGLVYGQGYNLCTPLTSRDVADILSSIIKNDNQIDDCR